VHMYDWNYVVTIEREMMLLSARLQCSKKQRI